MGVEDGAAVEEQHAIAFRVLDVEFTRIRAVMEKLQHLGQALHFQLAGQLKVQSLPQVLQFLHHSANTGELYIKNPERDGVLLFDGGTIFNAHSKEDTGVEAVYSLALLQEGTFQFTTTEIRPGGETNVSESMMSIVFECCRRFDEARQ